ncbi:hypothetical protein ACFQX7_38910 [Luedemannella flava]
MCPKSHSRTCRINEGARVSAQSSPTIAEIRHDYAVRFPQWSQQLITVVSGKAADNQRPPRMTLHPVVSWLLGLAQLPISVAISVLAVRFLGIYAIFVLPITWLTTVNSLRKLQVTFSHHAVHREMCESTVLNRMIQVISSTASFTHSYEDYFDEHVRSHHSRKVFTTMIDPDAAFLVRLGFLPGQDMRELRRRLWLTPVSPRFHALFILARIRTNFITATLPRIGLAILWTAGLAWLAWSIGPWEFILGVVVPFFPLYHISALIQFLSEHLWLASEQAPTSKADYANRCWGRFCLEPLPTPGAPVAGWVRWAARTVFVQVPGRFGVLVNDLPVHDLHHVAPAEHEWTTALWVRQRLVAEGHPSGMESRELSLGDAITRVLTAISTSPVNITSSQPTRAMVSNSTEFGGGSVGEIRTYNQEDRTGHAVLR